MTSMNSSSTDRRKLELYQALLCLLNPWLASLDTGTIEYTKQWLMRTRSVCVYCDTAGDSHMVPIWVLLCLSNSDSTSKISKEVNILLGGLFNWLCPTPFFLLYFSKPCTWYFYFIFIIESLKNKGELSLGNGSVINIILGCFLFLW